MHAGNCGLDVGDGAHMTQLEVDTGARLVERELLESAENIRSRHRNGSTKSAVAVQGETEDCWER